MSIKQIIPVVFAVLSSMTASAQDVYPKVSPTATYTDSNGDTVESDEGSPQVDGQAPLAVTFRANPSNMTGYTPVYEWHFRMEHETKDFMVRYEEDTEYTFTDSGTTLVILKVSLGQELELDSILFSVTTSESKLEFPNAFSPNGDEYNEIYKAKEYQSIVEFHAYIFNRWGQKLFDWTDPSQGWDGTYNGKDVKEGVYFVLVKAKGADGKEYNIRKDVNLLRGFTDSTSSNE